MYFTSLPSVCVCVAHPDACYSIFSPFFLLHSNMFLKATFYSLKWLQVVISTDSGVVPHQSTPASLISDATPGLLASVVCSDASDFLSKARVEVPLPSSAIHCRLWTLPNFTAASHPHQKHKYQVNTGISRGLLFTFCCSYF